jgi:hypothetical protein
LNGRSPVSYTSPLTVSSPAHLRLPLLRVLVAGEDGIPPPRRFIAGTDAIGTAEQKIADLHEQLNENRDLSNSLAYKK